MKFLWDVIVKAVKFIMSMFLVAFFLLVMLVAVEEAEASNVVAGELSSLEIGVSNVSDLKRASFYQASFVSEVRTSPDRVYTTYRVRTARFGSRSFVFLNGKLITTN
jgi:hypothetical protein